MRNVTMRRLLRALLVKLTSAALLIRGVLFMGRRYRCICCGWQLRGFVGHRDSVRAIADSYCPRCNSKANHRRIWLFLKDRSSIFDQETRLLEVAPWPSLTRALTRTSTVRYVGLDIVPTGPHVNLIGDVVAIPVADDSFDAVLCTHVLEHVADDRRAMSEIYRVLRPGGYAYISVPLSTHLPTIEDPSISDPVIRKALFGETGRVRYYGLDIHDRLCRAGFDVRLDRASAVPPGTRTRLGLPDDEHILCCRKPATADRNLRQSAQTLSRESAASIA